MTAQQKIDNAAANGQTRLDLINLNLTSLPTISHLTSLQELHLALNKLQTLPTLPPYLRKLYISGNNLQTLPTLPPTLQMLSASTNNLQTLPVLPHTLQKLDVSCNKLQTLPVLPPALWQLKIPCNHLQTLPDLSHLTELRYIDIFSNPITHSHINNSNHPLLKDKLTFNQRDIGAFNTAVSLFTNKNTYFGLLPRDITGIITEYINYIPVTVI